MNALIKRSIALGTALLLALLFSQTVAAGTGTNLAGSMTADNSFDVYISTDDAVQGTLIGSGTDWTVTYAIASALTPGMTNYIHIEAVNTIPPPPSPANPGAIIGDFTLSDSNFEFANETQILRTNTTEWTVSSTGWSSYGPPADLGQNGDPPWGASPNLAFIDANARFIWHLSGPAITPVYFSAAIIPVLADINITSVENTADPVIAGSGPNNNEFTFTVTNDGTHDATNVVALLDPTGTTISGLACSTTPSQGAVLPGGTWNIGSIAKNSAATLNIKCTVPSSAQVGQIHSETLSLTSLDQIDPDDTNNSSFEDSLVAREVEIEVTKIESIDPVVAGSGVGNLVYTVTAANNGPSDVTGLVINEALTLPTGVTLVGAVPSTGGWVDPNWTVDLASGASATLTVTLTVAANTAVGADTVSNTATATFSGGQEDITNLNEESATATESTSVAREVDIEVTKTESIDPVVAGSGPQNLTYIVTATNHGPSDVTDLVISDAITVPGDVTLNSVTPSNGLPAWSAPNWTVSLASGASATLTVVITVPLTAAEGTDVISDTAAVEGSNGGETFINTGDDSTTVATSIRWPEATFDVSKEYEGDSGPPVEVTLTCTDASHLLVYAPRQGTTETSLTVRRFDIFDATTSCTVTETVPNHFYEVGRTADCDVTAVDGATNADDGDGVYECTITNAPTFATFHVTKDFEPNNTMEVETFISCNDGLPIKEDQVVVEDSDGIVFIVEAFTAANLDCEITEVPVPDGYDESYAASIVDGDASDPTSIDGCQFTNVVSGDFACAITNTAQDATYEVNKVWDVIGQGGDLIDQIFDLTIACTREIKSALPKPENGGIIALNGVQKSVRWSRNEGDQTFTVTVDTSDGPASCWARETIFTDAVEIDNPCHNNQSLTMGQTTYCTITNTVFFEGIPTLNQYGLALLALLMMGIGAIGFRRFI